MRRFMYLLISIPLFFLLFSCNSLKIQNCGSFYALDTMISVTFYNTNNENEHYSEIKKIYYEIDNLASDYTEFDNNIYMLNKNRKIIAPLPLLNLITYSVDAITKTNGYFNPFIGRLTHMWKDSINSGVLLDDEVIKNELNIMNNTYLEIKDNEVSLIGDGNVDLGAVAKGYATYLVSEYLKDNNVKYYLIDAGKSNVLASSKYNDPFRFSFKNPLKNETYYTFTGTNLNIGTSSIEYQRKEIDGKLYHHIISPFTGYPENYYESINILADNSLDADLLSTSIFSMDFETAKKYIENNNIRAMIFNKEILYKSEDFV